MRIYERLSVPDRRRRHDEPSRIGLWVGIAVVGFIGFIIVAFDLGKYVKGVAF